MTESTQADRDAAAQHGLWLLDDERDALVEAFARHREQVAAEERAKIVAWLRKQQTAVESLRDEMNRFIAGYHMADEHASALEQSANAIESNQPAPSRAISQRYRSRETP